MGFPNGLLGHFPLRFFESLTLNTRLYVPELIYLCKIEIYSSNYIRDFAVLWLKDHSPHADILSMQNITVTERYIPEPASVTGKNTTL